MDRNIAQQFTSTYNIYVDESISGRNHTTNATSHVHIDYLSESTLLKLLFLAMYGAIFLVGVSGNALVLAIVTRNKNLQSPTNIFIANLALSDVLMCLLAVPFTPLNGMVSSWVLGEPLCRLVAMSSALSVHVSTQTSTAIAVDRYFAIVHPFKARLTARQCICVISLVWILSMAFSLPLAIYQQVEWVDSTEEFTCNENWPDIKLVRLYTLASLGLQYLVPCIVIGVCYSRVHSALSRRSRNKRHLRQRKNLPTAPTAAPETAVLSAPTTSDSTKTLSSDRHMFAPVSCKPGSSSDKSLALPAVTLAKESQELKRKCRTTNMLIAMVAIFVCCWLPLNVIMLTFDYAEDSLKFWPFRLVTFFMAHVIAMSSTVYNPFLYAWLNEAFREEFRRILPGFLFGCLTCQTCVRKKNNKLSNPPPENLKSGKALQKLSYQQALSKQPVTEDAAALSTPLINANVLAAGNKRLTLPTEDDTVNCKHTAPNPWKSNYELGTGKKEEETREKDKLTSSLDRLK